MTEQDILDCPDREMLEDENIICNGTDGKPDSYDCPRLIAEDRCPRGYKQGNRARPNWLWDEDAEYEQGYIDRAGVLSLRTYIKHLETENTDLKRKNKNLKKGCQDLISVTEQQTEKVLRLEAKVERLKVGAIDCTYCGESFVPPHDGYRYCSDDCRKADTNRIRMGKPPTKDLGRDDE